MKKTLIYKAIGIVMLLWNIAGIYDYNFSNKWFLLYDNNRFLYISVAIVGICLLGIGFEKKNDKKYLLSGLIASIPLIFFTVVFTINTIKIGMSTFLLLTTAIWLFTLWGMYKNNRGLNEA